MTKFFNLFIVLIVGACTPLGKALRTSSIDEKYEIAMNFYKGEEYSKAILVLNDVLPLLSGDKRGEQATFYYAYAHYYTAQYSTASAYFQGFHRTYRRSRLAEEALFMATFSLYQNTPDYTLDQAVTVQSIDGIQDFINRYPNSKFAPRANEIIDELVAKLEKKYYFIAKHYEKVGQYRSAVVAYENYLKDYPNNPYKEEVKFRLFRCQYQLANLSLRSLQPERYEKAFDYYEKFKLRYPESDYLKELETLNQKARKAYEKVKLEIEEEEAEAETNAKG